MTNVTSVQYFLVMIGFYRSRCNMNTNLSDLILCDYSTVLRILYTVYKNLIWTLLSQFIYYSSTKSISKSFIHNSQQTTKYFSRVLGKNVTYYSVLVTEILVQLTLYTYESTSQIPSQRTKLRIGILSIIHTCYMTITAVA